VVISDNTEGMEQPSELNIFSALIQMSPWQLSDTSQVGPCSWQSKFARIDNSTKSKLCAFYNKVPKAQIFCCITSEKWQ
jgi:hypothetical protein